eukprot:49046-Eustigmatos_ZCMA.PRE.1
MTGWHYTADVCTHTPRMCLNLTVRHTQTPGHPQKYNTGPVPTPLLHTRLHTAVHAGRLIGKWR